MEDISRYYFNQRLKHYGLKRESGNYYRLAPPVDHITVYGYEHWDRRETLYHLIHKQRRHEEIHRGQ